MQHVCRSDVKFGFYLADCTSTCRAHTFLPSYLLEVIRRNLWTVTTKKKRKGKIIFESSRLPFKHKICMYKISSAAKNTELLILLNVPSDFYQTEEKKKSTASVHMTFSGRLISVWVLRKKNNSSNSTVIPHHYHEQWGLNMEAVARTWDYTDTSLIVRKRCQSNGNFLYNKLSKQANSIPRAAEISLYLSQVPSMAVEKLSQVLLDCKLCQK